MEYGWRKTSSTPIPATDRSTFVAAVLERFGTTPRGRRLSPDSPGLGFASRLLLKGLSTAARYFMGTGVHERFVEDTGLPTEAVGAGFKYVQQGDLAEAGAQFKRV